MKKYLVRIDYENNGEEFWANFHDICCRLRSEAPGKISPRLNAMDEDPDGPWILDEAEIALVENVEGYADGSECAPHPIRYKEIK